MVTLSTSGNIGRAPTNGARRATVGRHDLIAARAMTTTGAEIMAVTSEGRAIAVRVQEVPDAAGRARGVAAAVLLGLNKGETVLTLLTDGAERLVLVTANGVAKRLTLDELMNTRSSATVISLKGDDRVVAAFRAPLGVDIALVASDGRVLRTPVDPINDQGRGAGGVAGMRLLGDAKVVGADVLLGDGVALTVTSAGGVKATPYGDLLAKGRGGQGVRIARLASGETVTGTWFGPAAMTDVYALMADYDDPRKLDPNPVALNIEASARDLVPSRTERQIMVVADARW